MVEALVQQLATARAPTCPTGSAPSDLREKLVQTDHTELSQVSTRRTVVLLYVLSTSSATKPSNILFIFYIDYNAQRPVLGGSEADWRAGVGWEVLTEPHQLYEGHESHNGANIIYSCLNSCIFNDKIMNMFGLVPTELSKL